MADSSSFMDWSPATPIPRHNPYPDNYIPGGWPEEPGESLIPTAGVFARQPAPSFFLPAAKRLCQGLGTAIVFGAQATTAVVRIPTYSIVRQVRQQRRRQRVRRQQRIPPLPESPWNRAVALREDELAVAARETRLMRMGEDLRRYGAFNSDLDALPDMPALVKAIPHHSAQGRLYHVPKLIPTGVATTKRKRCMEATTEKKAPTSTPLVFAGMPQFAPPSQESRDSTTPNKQHRILQPEHRNLLSLPRLDPSTISTRPPSPPTSESPPAPGDDQSQDHFGSQDHSGYFGTDKGSDSDTSSVRSYYLRPKKLRLRYHRTKDSENTKTAAAGVRTDTVGPSLVPPKARAPPPPAIVVQETTAAVAVEVPIPADENLLSPPRVKKRRFSTPKIKKTLNESGSPKTPGSDISSTCNCSPGNLTPRPATEATSPGESQLSSTCECSPENSDLTLRTVAQETSPSESQISSTCECSPGNLDLTPHATTQPKSPDESDISSMFIGTPPNQEEDARLFARIMAAIGGSPTPIGKKGAKPGNTNTPKTKDVSNAAKPEDDNLAINKDIPTPQPTSDTATSEDNNPTSDTATSEDNNVAINEDIPTLQPTSDTATSEDNIVTINEDIPDNQPMSDTAASNPSTPKRGHPEQTAEQPTARTGQESSMSDAANLQTPVQSLAKLTLEDPFTPDAPTPKASPHSAEKTQRVTRAEAKRLAALEEVHQYEIGPLEQEWEKKIQAALRSGHGDYKATDLTRVVPLLQGRGTDNWLNDEVINGYLKLIVEHGKKNDRPTQVPTHHAFVSFFYNNLEAKGYDSVKRWANRAKIGGKNLLETENVFIPINSGMHWTLCVVSGKNKTITHYNSLSGNGRKYVETVKKWVQQELGSAYKDDEWKMEFKGESPQQQNMDDCGVFTITSARQIMLGLTPMSYTAGLIELQRRRIVAELVNGALLKSGKAA
ncbi:hypothetical protein H2202_004017 [Exophiala xenobiotica]|nr:hypothetical protein H2202_004017 [Exophiala xenobiotica]